MDVAEKVRDPREINSIKTSKRRFLCAIGKAEPSPTEGDTENDNIVQEEYEIPDLEPVYPTNPVFTKYSRRRLSDEQQDAIERRYQEAVIVSKNPFINLLQKTNTTAENRAKKILQKNSKFDIGHYLACAKAIYLMSGRRTGPEWENWENNIGKSFTYILTHARLFGDQTQNMFLLNGNSSLNSLSINSLPPKPLPDTNYLSQITALIKDLKMCYDETKYRILNANVTYFTLLILRKFVQEEMQFSCSFLHKNTQDDYVKLCPQTLNCELPGISQHFIRNLHNDKLNEAVYLAIYAFLTVDDFTSKTILRVTCLEYIEWHNMHLPGLFFKVVSLYGLEGAKLWDMLICDKTSRSLSRMANIYYTHYKKSEADQLKSEADQLKSETDQLNSTAWFPYCWASGDPNHQWPLSGSQNVYLCTILAYIVDFKVGFGKSFIRKSDWATNRTAKKTGLKIAEAFQQFYEKS